MIDESSMWRLVYGLLVICITWGICTAVRIVVPPLNFPWNIPTIPFYVSFMGSYLNMDQAEIYHRFLQEKLEKHGAVKIYFASRWNILVSRPQYLLEIFKKEDVYAKSGNQIKIPSSVLSTYTGDNIISAHGQNWKLYRKVVSSSIQFPDVGPVEKNSDALINLISSEMSGNRSNSLSVGALMQKYTLQNIGESVFGVDFDVMHPSQELQPNKLHQSINYIKQQIFRPFYMNFPFFDQFPILSRVKARREVEKFRRYFCNLLKTLYHDDVKHGNFAANKLISALENNQLTPKQFTDNAIILMVAGHENPLLLILSLLYTIAKYRPVQEKLRKELQSGGSEFPYFNSVVYETLRMYPPLGQIINRVTTRPVMLGEIKIPQGVYVGYNNFATGRDSTVWGSDSEEFKPNRWGTTMEEVSESYASAKRSARLPAFHGRKRACLGEKFALTEVKAAIAKIILNFEVSLDPTWNERLTPAGPICPMNLKLVFKDLKRN